MCSPLAALGAALAAVRGAPHGGAGENSATLLSLTTTDGPLQLIGSGTWGPGGVKFRGEAHSAAVDEAALSNLLNIIGRRDGARWIVPIRSPSSSSAEPNDHPKEQARR